MRNQKTITIAGRPFHLEGDDQDTYFTNTMRDGEDFNDVPVIYARKYVPAGGVILDVGANIGTSACGFSDVVGANGKVLSIEASPNIYSMLAHNMQSNQLANVECFNVAMSDHPGTLMFRDQDIFLAGSRVVASGGVPVRAGTLDQFVADANLTKIDFIKIDVEGHERQVLEGAVNTIQRFKPKCLVEINAYVMIVLNRELPQPLLECIRKMFPYIYKVQRGGKGILEHMPTDDIFWMNHLLTGCCDDLLCSFDALL